ncbi:hypothetical protein BDN72DRAFT_516572 [Pluteus cervinus]|uniref:Uncharacterized protein n=1 Tax=Pluteus cervinus TaxID=181527 RepID=A0ACD3BCM6_9AGAR|nr:hypothetical protein BDN72DRAFT_516572 [Pluteus cervinus]
MAKIKWYAVIVGIEIGVFPKWTDVAPLVVGVPGAIFESFPTEDDANAAFDEEDRKGHTKMVRQFTPPTRAPAGSPASSLSRPPMSPIRMTRSSPHPSGSFQIRDRDSIWTASSPHTSVRSPRSLGTQNTRLIHRAYSEQPRAPAVCVVDSDDEDEYEQDVFTSTGRRHPSSSPILSPSTVPTRPRDWGTAFTSVSTKNRVVRSPIARSTPSNIPLKKPTEGVLTPFSSPGRLTPKVVATGGVPQVNVQRSAFTSVTTPRNEPTPSDHFRLLSPLVSPNLRSQAQELSPSSSFRTSPQKSLVLETEAPQSPTGAWQHTCPQCDNTFLVTSQSPTTPDPSLMPLSFDPREPVGKRALKSVNRLTFRFTPTIESKELPTLSAGGGSLLS